MTQIKLTVGNLLTKVILIIPHIIIHLKYIDCGRFVDEMWDSTGNELADLNGSNDV